MDITTRGVCPCFCEYCGSICDSETTKQGPNKGRMFYRCKPCGFFMWVEWLRRCDCGSQCKTRTSTKPDTKGQPFWCCGYSTGKDGRGCGFFKWIDGGQASNSDPCTPCSTTRANPMKDKMKAYLEGAVKESEHHTSMLKSIIDGLAEIGLNK